MYVAVPQRKKMDCSENHMFNVSVTKVLVFCANDTTVERETREVGLLL